jgi:hypothetical protein
MHLSLEVLLTVGADEEVLLTETELIRLLTDYIQETERLIIYVLFSTVIILFIFILFYFISVSTYQKYKCVEITECKLYMHVDDTNITT